MPVIRSVFAGIFYFRISGAAADGSFHIGVTGTKRFNAKNHREPTLRSAPQIHSFPLIFYLYIFDIDSYYSLC